MKPLIVVGHKNPDTDSICSSISYARYKSDVEHQPAVAYRAGNLNAQTRHVLEVFNTEPPDTLPDVHPRIRDIMIPRSQLLLVRPDEPIAGARSLMLSNRFSFLPIADSDDRCVGKLTALRLAALMDEIDPYRAGEPIHLHLRTLAELGRPSVYFSASGRKSSRLPKSVTGTLFPATGNPGESAGTRGRNEPVIIYDDIGNLVTQETGAAALAIVAGARLESFASLAGWARRNRTAVLALASEFTQTGAYLRLSQSASSCVEEIGPTFGAEETLRDVLRVVNRSNEGGFVVLDADNRITGVVTRVNFMTDARFRVVLVDHNELSQAVDGMEHAEIVEIIDHHRIGAWSSSEPITFVNRAVGSTCTIVAEIYRQSGHTPSRETAGLMLAGVLSDTVILRSPTATAVDRTAAEWLAELAMVNMDEFGERMFEAGSEMHRLTPREILELDLKYYEEQGVQFSVSQVETTGFKAFWDRSELLRDEVAAHRARAGLQLACLMVTDITHGTTLLVVSGEPRIVSEIGKPQPSPDVYEMHDVLSRKKQVLPYIVELIRAL